MTNEVVRARMTCPKTGQTEDDAWQGHLAILPTAPKGGVFEICERTPCCTPLLLQLSSSCSLVFCANLLAPLCFRPPRLGGDGSHELGLPRSQRD